jgi:hypothetical protein
MAKTEGSKKSAELSITLLFVLTRLNILYLIRKFHKNVQRGEKNTTHAASKHKNAPEVY